MLNNAVMELKIVVAWIKNFKKFKDGRGAWLPFCAHYLGSSQIDWVVNHMEA